ncbi:MAG: ABC transporter ATP-binding protein [Planctomycetes bacterium]|nr:ABC transporter ATP-binding protein [Planctomycetota bacterium]
MQRRFGEQTALAGLDLVLHRGEFLGLLGPNGAGKTTTLRMISCVDRPDAGTVRVLGCDPATDSPKILARMGVVPQELALYDSLTARENLDFFAGLYGMPTGQRRERVGWALEHAGLVDRASSRVGGFSGGMKRRLNLVAALMHEPELVLLDEPTVGVDPQSRNHLLEMIDGLRGKVSLIYTTHQMGEIERLCDRIAIMDQGRVVANGTLEELRIQAEDSLGGDHRLELQDGAQMERAMQILQREGVACSTISVGADLESIFLATTGKALRDGEA